MAHATLLSISKISVIQQDDANHYRNIADVPSAPGARNCVFVPESGGNTASRWDKAKTRANRQRLSSIRLKSPV